jgi:hypothetical protein
VIDELQHAPILVGTRRIYCSRESAPRDGRRRPTIQI